MASLHRMPALDGVRGLAILLVLVAHVFGLNGAGLVGVLLFFVLSGYLITSILLKEIAAQGAVNLRAFYVRRALRLLPALVLLLSFLILLTVIGATPIPTTSVLLGATQALFYVTDFVLGFTSEATPGLAHLWTLAVEEQFYSLWPIAVLLFLRGFRSRRLRALGWMIGVSVLLRLLTVLVGMRQGWFFYALPTLWFECLLGGALLAVGGFEVGQCRPSGAMLRRAMMALCWGIMFLAAVHPGTFLSPITYVLGIPVLTASSMGLLTCASATGGGVTTRVLGAHALRWLGEHSYGLYLFNSTAILVTSHWLGHGLASRALGAGAAVGLAVLSRRFVEVPALKLKSRLTTASMPVIHPLALRSSKLANAKARRYHRRTAYSKADGRP